MKSPDPNYETVEIPPRHSIGVRHKTLALCFLLEAEGALMKARNLTPGLDAQSYEAMEGALDLTLRAKYELSQQPCSAL